MLIARWLLFISFAALLSRDRKHPKKKLNSPDNSADPAYGKQPSRPPKPTYKEGWHPKEEKHRRREGRYWLAASVLSAVVAIGAGLSADAYVTKAEDVDVAWFNFKPTYKNFGPSPAENAVFVPHVFVVGAGPSPREACKTGAGWTMRDISQEIVFPQDEGGGWVGVQVPLRELKEEAARVLAIQPSATVYLGIVGCLLYQSANGADTYVTGFVGDLHMAGGQQDNPDKYIPLYSVVISGSEAVEVGVEVKRLGAWAD